MRRTMGFIPWGEIPEAELATLHRRGKARVARHAALPREGNGYFQIQATRPQTLSYALTDSPVGQLAWIVEKFKEWTNSGARAAGAGDRSRPHADRRDDLLADRHRGLVGQHVLREHALAGLADPSTVPTGVAVFAEDMAIRRYAERVSRSCTGPISTTGGHFAAMETPELLVADVAAFFRELRTASS